MISISFLAEWALRSSVLIAGGALLLWALRVKDSSTRVLAWTAMLCGSLALPLLTTALPKARVPVWSAPPREVSLPAAIPVTIRTAPLAKPFDWAALALAIYLTVAAGLLLRLAAGVVMSRRLLRACRPTGQTIGEIEIRESDRVAAPVTLGILRSAIVLPADWREWDSARLDAVLAHERSHIGRRDPAVQVLSSIHRALLWHSPVSWYLHARIVRAAEEASDDAAVAVTLDRASYAECLLDFMRRGVRGAGWQGVAMARYGNPGERIDRILDGNTLSRGVTRLAVAAILVLGSPVAYVAAAAHPAMEQAAPPAPPAPPEAPPIAPPAVPAAPEAPATPAAPAAQPQAPAPPQNGAIRRYMIFSDDSASGSWDSSDPVDDKALRARFGRHFAWFRQAGSEYVVTDAGVLAELDKAMEPQKKVNAMQGEVNAHQSKVNAMQSGVNAQQNDVNTLQQEANRRQDLVNRIQSLANKPDQEALIQNVEKALQELRANKSAASQDAVNHRQAQVNEAQSRVNAEQHVVNGEQQKVNEEQHRVSAEFNGKIQQILDSAVKRHLAQRLM